MAQTAQQYSNLAQKQIEQYRRTLEESLNDKSKPWAKAFEFLEAKTNCPRLYLFVGAAVFCALYMIFGYGAQLLCNIIGVVYPAYISIHAIESSTKADDTKWLIYWVTFSLLSIVEYFSGFLTSIIPFYWLLKCIFLVWCMLPMENNGSIVIYTRVVRPHFLKHHKAADAFLNNAKDEAKKVIGNVMKND